MSETVEEGEEGPRVISREQLRCPVVHEDYSQPLEACGYLQKADAMREAAPLFFNEFAQGYWVFTRHDAVRDIYKHPDIFSSDSITPWVPEPPYRFIPTQINPPEHIKYRRVVNPWFAPARMDEAAEMVHEVCRKYVEQTAALGRCDLVAGFAMQFPTEVFLRVIGADPEMTEDFVRWVEDFFKGFGGDPESQGVMVEALTAIRGYWQSVLDDLRGDSEPQPGVLASHIQHATKDGELLPEEEQLDMLVVLTLAGLDTTRGTLGYIFRHLAQHPEHRARLIAEPELIPTFCEEALRYYTIIFGDGRKVTRDVEFHGVQLRAGDMVYGLVAAANRDPRAWEQPDEFVIDRRKNNHFGFASGPHRCLGMHLARRELQVAVEEWLKVIPDFRLATDGPLRERGGGNMTTLLSLPLVWETSA